ncbi:valine--tRNA ligase [Chironomus tepperi]|uniref:valine--tRNA ligase n=1 Tax=Chironomus tepperi TaxID=113505 RepID=UPI00391F4C42
MILRQKISLIKLKQSIRLCCQKSQNSSKLLNDQLRIAAYQPSKIENVDISQASSIHSGNNRFSMIFPPPNITGNLHLGHALTATIQDVIARWKRKQGSEIQWIFGTDHAGIATQVVVEKILHKKYGKTRHEIGREDFLNETWNWKLEKGCSIKDDLKKLGTTFNWNKEYFTLDPNLSNAVNEAFIRLFEKNLIYRDNSLINWSCALESAISDIEVENLEVTGTTQIAIPNYDKNVTVGVLTDFAYKIVDSDEEIVVSTTRPETMLGDTAVAVHPEDSRYSHLINKKLYHPYRNEEIPLIFDESVDPNFGTGAVKITPSHDKNDFEIGKRHKLPNISVITENGSIIDNFSQFKGLPRFEAREIILNDLANLQLLRGSKSHNMVLPICSRSKDIVEFMIKPQWYVKCNEMSKKAVTAVETGEIKIIPSNFEKEWYRWLTNCRDWCISRQLWWGHQIPAYKFTNPENNNEIWIAAHSQDEAEMKFKKTNEFTSYTVTRDQDVLDTWFSSGLLPFTVFDWPNSSNEDLKKYFPLNLMETGHDILFFWVARMVMLSIELTGQVPFKEILLHGIMCDSFGRKMSKSLGNVILPEQVIKGATLDDLRKETEKSVEKGILSKSELEKSIQGQKKMFVNGIQECGVDALRFTLCSQNTKQHFINFDVNECVTNKLFFNKIWQATKYAINYAEIKNIKVKGIKDVDLGKLSTMDLWILSRLGNTIKAVKHANEEYNFHLSTSALKNFFYNNFCDVYLETTKNDLKEHDRGFSSAQILNLCLSIGLDYMEIFTPYLVKELKNYLPENVLFDAEKYVNDELENQINELLDICASIREAKSHLKLTKKHKSSIIIHVDNENHEKFLNNNLNHMLHLTFSENLKIITDRSIFDSEQFDMTLTANHMCSFGIKILESRDKSNASDEAINTKKLKKLEDELQNMLNVVSKDGYKEKANEKVQQKHRDKIEKLRIEIDNIKQIRK